MFVEGHLKICEFSQTAFKHTDTCYVYIDIHRFYITSNRTWCTNGLFFSGLRIHPRGVSIGWGWHLTSILVQLKETWCFSINLQHVRWPSLQGRCFQPGCQSQLCWQGETVKPGNTGQSGFLDLNRFQSTQNWLINTIFVWVPGGFGKRSQCSNKPCHHWL